MKLNELKCKNCGANLKVKKGDESVTCPYCSNTYTIDYSNDSSNTNNDTNTYSASDIKTYNKTVLVIVICVAIFFVLVPMFIVAFSRNSGKKVYTNSEIWDFNSHYYNGTSFGVAVGYQLDDVITSNKTNKKKKITVEYLGESTKDPDEILAIKQKLGEFTYYEVVLEYDDDGLVDRFIIK